MRRQQLEYPHVAIANPSALLRAQVDPAEHAFPGRRQPERDTVRAEVPFDVPPQPTSTLLPAREHIGDPRRAKHESRLRRNSLLFLDEQAAGSVEVVVPIRRKIDAPVGVDICELEYRAALCVRVRVEQPTEDVACPTAIARYQPPEGSKHRLGEHLRAFHLSRFVEEVEDALHISV